jgi:hypothetical protein
VRPDEPSFLLSLLHSCTTLPDGTRFICGGYDGISCYQLSVGGPHRQPNKPLFTYPRWRDPDPTRHTVATRFVQGQGGDDGTWRGSEGETVGLIRTHLDKKEKILNQQCDVKSPALVWHTNAPYQDSGEPSTRVSHPGGVVRERQSNIKYPEYH